MGTYSIAICVFFVCDSRFDGCFQPASDIVEILHCTARQADNMHLHEGQYIAWPCEVGECDDRANIGGN